MSEWINELLMELTRAVDASEMSLTRICLTLLIAMLFAGYIYFIYRTVNRSGFYSKSFNKTIAVMTVITSGMVLSMQASVFISLGMVGALSIVRYRSVVKEPFDLLFLFWSISTGIICGTGLFRVAVFVAAAVTAALFLLELVPGAKAPMLLVVNGNDVRLEDEIMPIVKGNAKSFRIKSRNLSPDGLDMIVELRTDAEKERIILEACGKLSGVRSVALLSHDGEIRG